MSVRIPAASNGRISSETTAARAQGARGAFRLLASCRKSGEIVIAAAFQRARGNTENVSLKRECMEYLHVWRTYLDRKMPFRSIIVIVSILDMYYNYFISFFFLNK